jgi:hypothetical protein
MGNKKQRIAVSQLPTQKTVLIPMYIYLYGKSAQAQEIGKEYIVF